MKRIRIKNAALAVIAVMVFGFISPVAVLANPGLDVAEYFTDADGWEDAVFSEAAYFLGHAGIFRGDQQHRLLPFDCFTRAQMAAVLTRMKGESRLAGRLETGSTSWDDDADIPTWARGYMVLAQARGWFEGYPDGTVRPNENLSFAEIATLLARVTDNAHLLQGPWPVNAMIAAEEMGLFEDAETAYSDLDILRGEMVSATFRAMMTAGRLKLQDRDGKSLETEPLMARHHRTSWNAYHEYRDVKEIVTGQLLNYYPRTERISIDGTRYDVRFDEDFSLVVNQNEISFTKADAISALWDLIEDYGLVDETVTAIFDDGAVVAITAMLDTYADALLSKVEVDKDEDDFGFITVDGRKLAVDDDTEVWLDGKRVKFSRLGKEFADFQKRWADEPAAVAHVRTYDNAVDSEVIWVSVSISNIVEGEIVGTGRDLDGAFVRIKLADGTTRKVHYRDIDRPSGEAALLLDSTGIARVLLTEPAPVDKRDYYAQLDSYEETARQLTVIFITADGTDVTFKLHRDDHKALIEVILEDLAVGDIAYLQTDRSDLTGVTAGDAMLIHSGELTRVRATYIRVDADTYPFAEAVFAFDEDGKRIVTGGLSVGDSVEFGLDAEDSVGYIIVVSD